MTSDNDAAGRLTRVDHGNGTAVVRQYDAADRPTLIRHEDAVGDAMLELAYTYSADGLVTKIIETDEVSEASSFPPPPGEPVPPIISQVDFEYDNRNRLTRETRDTVNHVVDIDLGVARYDLSYTYDVGGNRLTKTNHRSGVVTTYHYDIETLDTIDNGQHNNRLLWYELNADDLPMDTAMAQQLIESHLRAWLLRRGWQVQVTIRKQAQRWRLVDCLSIADGGGDRLDDDYPFGDDELSALCESVVVVVAN